MEAYNMHNFINTEIESQPHETTFNLHICEANEFDVNLTKSTTLSFIVTKRNIKIITRKWINSRQESMIGKSYIIPTQAFHYLLPIICENEEEMIIQVQSFGTSGELLLNERLLINKNNRKNSTKITSFFEALNENIIQTLRTFQIQCM
ncbi:DUF3978 family protein [Bacillus cytotoxicus]|uniref:DUF3978 family protein n=1 Tax=Bacillus cytotoxicus TaxID=580165 RepID=UPI00065F8E66|nr:DUF3978 family protein [Bacillus cytotoxicus]KMT49476.1 hypothetical protein TU51_12850 [Bacillus cytotoxicus]MDH2859960.1 DUF3978 domain-containing protein [Bacillus cytotoxicus]MDH2870229.1 DUF3978 domain-containing protein [Bacillus cytotoxicus]MDH2874096.1 DUF3978 domain-containing protein [Bacillus cytotoxicus]MDH2876554.1 DUF3978 domain-containing protein [Bacillus cytotoxicus]